MNVDHLRELLEARLKYMANPYNSWQVMKDKLHPSPGRFGHTVKMEFREPIMARANGDYIGYRLVHGQEKTLQHGIVKDLKIVEMNKKEKMVKSEGYELIVNNIYRDDPPNMLMIGEYINGFPYGFFTITHGDDDVLYKGIIRATPEGKKMKIVLIPHEPEIDSLVMVMDSISMN